MLLLTSLLGGLASAQTLAHGFVDEQLVGASIRPSPSPRCPTGAGSWRKGRHRAHLEERRHPARRLQLRTRVNDYWDRGLLGLAADPDFAQNSYVYLFYIFYIRENAPFTYSGPKTARLVRVTATGDTAIRSSLRPFQGVCLRAAPTWPTWAPASGRN